VTILNMRTMPHVCRICVPFDTDVENVKATALMVLAGSDPCTTLATWLNRGCVVPYKAISLVFDNDTCVIIYVSLYNDTCVIIEYQWECFMSYKTSCMSPKLDQGLN